MPASTQDYVFVNKTRQSKCLTRSSGLQRAKIYSHVQPSKIRGADSNHNQYPTAKQAKAKAVNTSPATKLGAVVPPQSVCSVQLVARFIDQHTGPLGDEQLGSHAITPLLWLRQLPSLLGSDRVLSSSILALAAAAVGSTTNDPVLLAASRCAYGTTLTGLRQRMVSKVHATSDGSLAACANLLLYQLFNELQVEQPDWGVHVQGISDMLQSRGHVSFRGDLAREIFSVCRAHVVFAALAAGQHTYLAEPSWRDNPWAGSAKSCYEQMVDCVALLPTLRNKLLLFHNDVSESDHLDRHAIKILALCKAAKIQTDSCCSILLKSSQPPAVVPTSPSLQMVDDPFPESFEFRNISDSIIISALWACRVEIMLVVNEVLTSPRAKGLHRTRAFASQVFPGDLTQDTTEHARKICMSVHYLRSKVRGLFGRGPFYVLFPLLMAKKCYTTLAPRFEDEMTWCNAMTQVLLAKGPA